MCGGSRGGDDVSNVPTVLDKSPWDSKSITAILCVSQVIFKKTVLSIILKMHNPSSPPSTMLKDQKNLPRRFQRCTWGGGG